MTGVPLAVSPATLSPGLYMTVNLLAGTISPGTATMRGLFISPRSSAGNLTLDEEVRPLGGSDDARTAFGPKTPGYLAAVQFFHHFPGGILYAIAPTASSGSAATGTLTFSSTPTSTRTVRITIAGRIVDVTWAASESGDTLKARAVLAINGRDDVAATASATGTGIVTLTAPFPGPWGNDIQIACELLDGAGGSVALSGDSLSGGTTEPDFTTSLVAIAGQEFAFIAPLVSNAEAQSSSASTNVARVLSQVNTYNHGRNPKLQCTVVGVTGSLASAKTGVVARNDPTLEYVFCLNGQSLPAEWAGAELGQRMSDVEIDPAMNRIPTLLDLCVGASDQNADAPTDPEEEDALAHGLSIVTYNAQGQPQISRPVTAHSQDSNGNPDRRCFDVSGTDTAYALARDIREWLPQQFPRAKISKDLAPGDEPLPEGVIEERDVRAALITRLRLWQAKGVIRRDILDQVIANGTLVARQNPDDGTQVDIVIPEAAYQPVAKWGVVINKVA